MLAGFVLQFSTGENVAVTGNGLVGRNPVAEPGEYFDQLVTIADPGKSVSKTHLEFGQGERWILDPRPIQRQWHVRARARRRRQVLRARPALPGSASAAGWTSATSSSS